MAIDTEISYRGFEPIPPEVLIAARNKYWEERERGARKNQEPIPLRPWFSSVSVVRTGETEQVGKIGGLILERLRPLETSLILTAPGGFARESAKILGKILDSRVRVERVLEGGGVLDLASPYQLIDFLRTKVGSLVLVSEERDFVENFPRHLTERDLDKNSPLCVVNFGQGVFVDYRSRDVIALR